jgi:thiamine biosynthesis lipoprotein
MSMACLYAIEAYGPDSAALPRILEEALDEVDRIDRLMSHYKPESPLSQLNREARRGPVNVEPELFDFIAEAMRYSRESNGAFDITVGPLMKAWGFFGGDGRLPSEQQLANARRSVGARHVVVDHRLRTIAFDDSGVELDLGGIAKGYAVDRAASVLRRRGVTAALISAGGSSVYGLGAPPNRESWSVAIEDPVEGSRIALNVELRDRALSIAGSSEKFFEVEGTRYSHIMDPRSGRPVRGILTVAVLSPNATSGDALDDALFVLGPKGSESYLRKLRGVDAYFLLPASDRKWSMIKKHGGEG